MRASAESTFALDIVPPRVQQPVVKGDGLLQSVIERVR